MPIPMTATAGALAHEALRRQTKNFKTQSKNVTMKTYQGMRVTGSAGGAGHEHNHNVAPVAGGPPDYGNAGFGQPKLNGYSDTGMPNPGDHIYDIPKIIDDKINEAVAHLVAELDGMAQRCEELEIELECMRNAFPEHEDDILPKHRGKFNDY